MSGVEVAGLVIGVLPILFEVVKSYSAVRDKVHTFRHCTQEIEDLFVELKVIQVSFLNEVRWILRSIEDKQQAKIDLEDCDGQRWTSREAEIQLNAILQDNYDAFGEIMRRTKRALEGMAIELEILDPLLVQKSQGESVRKVYKRLRKALHITFNRSKYDTCLASLRNRNSELCALRSQIVAIEQQDAPLGGVCIRHVPVPVRFKTVQNTSRQLHESLCRAWRCDHSSHYGHNAKLCLDADGVDEVILDLAISCHESLGANSPSPSQESTIWLYVQSTSTSPKPQLNTPERQENSNICTKLAKELLPPDVSSSVKCLKKKASSDLSENATPKKKKLRRVHFEDTIASFALHLPTSNTLFTFGIDLYKTKSICDHLRQCYKEQLSAPAKRCIGYLESAQMYKHVFYFRDGALKPGLDSTASATVSTVKQALTQEVYDALQPEDRLRLAHKLAVAMLQYNDTPWLPDRWRLENLNYLGSKVTFDVEAFRTLHFNSQISQSTASAVADSPMEDLQQGKSKVSDETRFGITNTPLFFLGVAMLEIAYWTPIEEKMTEADENNQIFAARRLVLDRGAPLGPEYQRIAQKCLECNFGFGNKLSNKGLQSAVYNDVVCQLDNMIQRLEKLSV